MNEDTCTSCNQPKQHAKRCRNRRCEELGVQCAGCGAWLNFNNTGGYQNFCEKCVANLGEPPKGCLEFSPRGQYPNLYWECFERDGQTGATRNISSDVETEEF